MPTTTEYKITGLIISLALPCFVVLIPLQTNNLMVALFIKESCFWLLFVALFAVMQYGEREPFSSLGFSHNFFKSLGPGLVTLVGIYAIVIFYGVLYFIINHGKPPHEPLMEKITALPLWFKMLLAVRAGVIEETFFRGYAIKKLQQLTGNRIIAIGLPLLIFAAGHITYGTVNHFLVALIIGAVLTFSYLKTNNLVANIIAHALYDGIALLAMSVHR